MKCAELPHETDCGLCCLHCGEHALGQMQVRLAHPALTPAVWSNFFDGQRESYVLEGACSDHSFAALCPKHAAMSKLVAPHGDHPHTTHLIQLSGVSGEEGKLLCIQCERHVPGRMQANLAYPALTRTRWERSFDGTREDFVLDGGCPDHSFVALCPDHAGLFKMKLLRGPCVRLVKVAPEDNRKWARPSHGMALSRYLWDERAFADFEVQCGDKDGGSCGESIQGNFRVHRCVLAMASPVFAAMLQSEFTEAQQRKLRIADESPGAIEAMLAFAYTGELWPSSCSLSYARPSMSTLLIELMRLGDKYGMPSLVEAACRKMLACLDSTNVLAFARGLRHYEEGTSMGRVFDRMTERVRADTELCRAVLREM
mmetsp:Transcript_97880/g.299095  ORF Transcript_97880/g.299095 Transcript_97880/m.299095 type:complete len:371 (-) Transcript_97880:79-1191(-)